MFDTPPWAVGTLSRWQGHMNTKATCVVECLCTPTQAPADAPGGTKRPAEDERDPRKRAKQAPKRRKAPPEAPLPETPRSNEATASSGADSDDSDDVPLTHLARRTVVDL